MQYIDLTIEKLGLEKYENNKLVSWISQRIKVDGKYISLVLLILLGIFFLATPFGHTILISVFTFLYPSYKSFKALQTNSQHDDKKWLIYWIVYSFMQCIEVLLGSLIQVSSYSFAAYKPN